ncbi:MBL fold metallo-hydrolase [Williamsia sterculiae]|uniref:L-ascorbate metabolism protein UlaG, beta-lactamase superfamily n=1 Tax=Williamsia sterculiae TaxID=1344003 RepID=A0A1N7D2N0_9NOCA|nr:MBL fold metallo-hydrolase [Williamsia sterculiae]SIR70126.1 L-ascorbate metabolism protein UlaG, beta-lactamase superfamily [Williamsia sterculiae]
MTASSTAMPVPAAFTALGGPSVVIELGRVRLLVDPTFDPAGEYPIGSRALMKTFDAVLGPEDIGTIDAVLLSHDQHADNLDRGGRRFLGLAPLVLTTTLAASRLDGVCRGLEPWETAGVGDVTVTAVPAQHGPNGTEELTGPVIGFVLSGPGAPTVYVSGDNALLAVVRQVAERFPTIGVAVLFAGAARTPLIDGFLTLTSDEAAEAARLLAADRVLAVHTDGWAHFTEDATAVRTAFERVGIERLLIDATPGRRTVI